MPYERIGDYEAWLRQFVRHAEAGRKLASELREAARRQGRKLHDQRFSSHAQRLYNEEVYWTLQIEGVASLAAAERTSAETGTAAAVAKPKSKPTPAAAAVRRPRTRAKTAAR